MRGLAEYAMRGRRQAILAVLISGLIPLANTVLNPALMALVILRHGPAEGIKILPWAILPAIGWAMLGDLTHLVVLLGATALAVLLRRSASWQITLIGSILVGVGAELLLRLYPQFVDMLQQQVQVLLQANGNTAGLDDPDAMRAAIRVLFGMMTMVVAVCLLILARWWQAALYNPGGFGREFRQLRLDYRFAAGLVLLVLVANFGAPMLQGWVVYFLTPLFFAGLALIHGLAALKGVSRVWLIVFYVVLLNPLTMQILALAALMDSWYDFRSRVKPAV